MDAVSYSASGHRGNRQHNCRAARAPGWLSRHIHLHIYICRTPAVLPYFRARAARTSCRGAWRDWQSPHVYCARFDAGNACCVLFGIMRPQMLPSLVVAVQVMYRHFVHKKDATSVRSFGSCWELSTRRSFWHLRLRQAGSRQCRHVLQCCATHGGQAHVRQFVRLPALCLSGHTVFPYALAGFATLHSEHAKVSACGLAARQSRQLAPRASLWCHMDSE